MERYWDLIKEIVRESDIVLEVLDARSVESSKNDQLEEIIAAARRPKIIVLNKADLVSKEQAEIETEKILRDRNISKESIVYFSNRKRKTVRNLLTRIKIAFAKYGKRADYNEKISLIKKPYREAKGDIVVGVVGYPNVGKSSIINALSFKKKTKVSSKAGTTHGIHWISAGNTGVKLIDTPGVIPLKYQEEARLGLIAAKGPEKMKDPELVCQRLVEMFIKEKKIRNIEEFYDIKFDEEERNNPALMIQKLSIARHHLRKGGLPDEMRTSIMVIRDWQRGNLRL